MHVLKKLLAQCIQQHRLSAIEQERYDRVQLEFAELDKKEFNKAKKLQAMISATKKFIEDLERAGQSQALLETCKENKLYRIIYHLPVHQGIDDQSGLMSSLKAGFVGVGISAALVLFFAATVFLAAPAWLTVIATGLFVAASTYLSALLYGVVNDLFATKSNMPYFMLGHQEQQRSLIRSNNPVVQGIAWGVAATFGPALLASIVFAIAVSITAAFVPIATFVVPVLFMSMPLIAWGTDRYAKRQAQVYLQHPQLDSIRLGSNPYQMNALDTMSATKEEKAAWAANSDRNLFGFTKVPLIGLGALAGIITLSAVHVFLPAVVFSTILSIACPIAFAAFACIALLVAGIYLYKNKDRQIDDRFKLAFDTVPSAEQQLYFDEDLDLVAQLSTDFDLKKQEADFAKAASEHFSNPLSVKRSPGKPVEEQVETPGCAIA